MRENLHRLLLLAIAILFLQHRPANAATGQIQDSLEAQFDIYKRNNIENASTVKLLQILVDNCANEDLPKALYYAQEALRIAEKTGDKKLIATSYNFFGRIYREQGLYELASVSFYKSLHLWEKLNDADAIAFSLNDVGNIYYDQGDYDKAYELYNKALSICKANNLKSAMAVSLNNMGLVKHKQNDNIAALKYYKSALDVRKQITADATLIPHSHNYLGQVYADLGLYDSALYHFSQAARLCLPVADKEHGLLGTIYCNTAQTYILLSQDAKADYFYNLAENIYKKYNNLGSLAELYIEKGTFKAKQRKYAEAEAIFRQAITYATQYNAQPLLEEIYKSLALLYQDQGKFKEAYNAQFAYERIKDSLASSGNMRRILSIQHQYELEKKEGALKDVEELNKYQHAALVSAQRTTRLLIILSVAGIITMLFLVYFYIHKTQVNNQLRLHSDIIEKQNAEIEEKNKAMMAAKEQAENSALAKSEFLSSMSHEIRTPMSGIIGFVNLLLEDNLLSLDQREKLLSINYSADKLMHIINDVLHLSSIEAGSVVLEREPMNIRKLAEELISNIKAGVTNQDVQFALNIQQNVPRSVMGDPTRLYQILLNLLGNAKKFTHKGWIRLNIYAEPPVNNWVNIVFEVADTGIGIASNKLDSIFNSFEQADNGIIHKYGGTGLGLSITKKLVLLKKGKITVKSEPGKGSAFIVDLPFECTEDVMETPVTPVKSTAIMNLEGMRVLLVEDNEINQLVISQQMKKWLVEVKIVNDGYSALESLKQELFDAVLLDIQLPGIDGFETVREIRNSKTYTIINPFVPVIGLTADVFDETRKHAITAGMNDLLTKPAKPEDIYQSLAKYYSPTEMVQHNADNLHG
ncbi:MAG: tetratricopeptide repeat protein [Sphingobacteriales bacterium]|nr:MAG: tetratricopeptide repeat protein [Sphingobacteriales bacterium]